MSDHQDTLKAMLQDIINGKEEQAAVTMHDYFVAKTREVTGLASSQTEEDLEDFSANVDTEDEEASTEE